MKKRRITVLAIAALLTAGCASPDARTPQPTAEPIRFSVDGSLRKTPSVSEADLRPHPAGRQPSGHTLPWATVEYTIPDAVPNEGDSDFLGLLVAPAYSGVLVADNPDGRHIAKLPDVQLAGEGWMPVIEKTAGWYRVLLPSRMNLPSEEDGPVNGATGWVEASQMETKRSETEIVADLGEGLVTVLENGNPAGEYEILLDGGATTVRGQTYVVSRYTTSTECSNEPWVMLSSQLEEVDGYLGQTTAINAIHAFSEACQQITGYTQATPGCVIVSESDLAEIKRVPDGTPVIIQD